MSKARSILGIPKGHVNQPRYSHIDLQTDCLYPVKIKGHLSSKRLLLNTPVVNPGATDNTSLLLQRCGLLL
jgi:hypothetical protein